MNFEQRLQRGQQFEEQIAGELSKTHVVYRQINDGSTVPDMYMRNKETHEIKAVEVKAQPTLNWLGVKCFNMPTNDFNKYVDFVFTHSMELYLFYIDTKTYYIYVANFAELVKSKQAHGVQWPNHQPREASQHWLHDKTMFLFEDFKLWGAINQKELN